MPRNAQPQPPRRAFLPRETAQHGGAAFLRLPALLVDFFVDIPFIVRETNGNRAIVPLGLAGEGGPQLARPLREISREAAAFHLERMIDVTLFERGPPSGGSKCV